MKEDVVLQCGWTRTKRELANGRWRQLASLLSSETLNEIEDLVKSEERGGTAMGKGECAA